MTMEIVCKIVAGYTQVMEFSIVFPNGYSVLPEFKNEKKKCCRTRALQHLLELLAFCCLDHQGKFLFGAFP
jgi:hypothetical protein